MPDAVKLMKAIKRAAVEAVKATKPAEVCFGRVTEKAPLRILVEQKMILGEAQLVLSRNVTDYVVYTDRAGDNLPVTVRNGLAAGDEVILLRQQGGQKYIVVDRVG